MTMIPFAPAAPPPGAPATAAAPATGGRELSGVFSALVSALSQEFLAPGDGSAADGATPDPVDGTETTVDETDAASVVAMLLSASTAPAAAPTLDTPPEGGDADQAGELPSDLGTVASTDADGAPDSLTTLAPADVVPDADVEPPLGPRADGSAETGVSEDSGVSEDLARPDLGASSVGDDGEALETHSTTTDTDTDPADVVPADTDRVDTDPDATDGPETGPARPVAPTPSQRVAPADGAAAAPAQTAPAQTAPAAAVDGPAAPTTSARTAAPALPDQLVTVLTPLRSAPDGTHRVGIQLRPDELGEVQIDVVVRGNEIALNVRADLPATADLLRASLAELRAQLEAAGFDAGDLDVAHHGPDGDADLSDDRTDGPRADGPEGDRTATDDIASGADVPATQSTTSAIGLDLRL